MNTFEPATPYNHIFTLCFSMYSGTEDGSDISGAQFRAALLKRIGDLPDDELMHAVGIPDETQYRDPAGILHTLKDMPCHSDSELETALIVRDWMRDRSLHAAPKPVPPLVLYRHDHGPSALRDKALPLARFCLAVHRFLPDDVREDHAFDADIIPAILDKIPFGPDCMPAATPQELLPRVLTALRPAPLPVRPPEPSAEAQATDDDSADEADGNAPTVSSEYDIQCPACGRDDCIEIAITAFARLSVDGTDPGGDHDWDSDSAARCTDCGWHGHVRNCSADAIAAAKADAASKAGKRIMAEFVPQAWLNDHAIAVDPQGDTMFDVTDDILPLGKRSALLLCKETCSFDHLRHSSTAPQWVKDWSGPFTVNVKEAIAAYFADEPTL